MSEDVTQALKSSTDLFNVESVENEDRVRTIVRSEDGNVVAGSGSERTIFFNLEVEEDFDKKGILFEPKSHRIGKNGSTDYITVEKLLTEFDESILDRLLMDSQAEQHDTDREGQDSVDAFSTTEVEQNLGDSKTISVTSTDSDMLSDIDVHKF
jgi:hypothetical protein